MVQQGKPVITAFDYTPMTTEWAKAPAEPQKYEIVLTDAFGPVSYIRTQDEVSEFISGINFDVVLSFTVHPTN